MVWRGVGETGSATQLPAIMVHSNPNRMEKGRGTPETIATAREVGGVGREVGVKALQPTGRPGRGINVGAWQVATRSTRDRHRGQAMQAQEPAVSLLSRPYSPERPEIDGVPHDAHVIRVEHPCNMRQPW